MDTRNALNWAIKALEGHFVGLDRRVEARDQIEQILRHYGDCQTAAGQSPWGDVDSLVDLTDRILDNDRDEATT
tara:strand:+ start:1221 stop:1442 length:222 start_codon:yes stop_codon:yes gene_type:complete